MTDTERGYKLETNEDGYLSEESRRSIEEELIDDGEEPAVDPMECQRCETDVLGSPYRCASCGYRPRLETAAAGLALISLGPSIALTGVVLSFLIVPLILIPTGALLAVVGLLYLCASPVAKIDTLDAFPDPHAPTGERPD